MKKKVILKKDEKVKKIFEEYGLDISEEKFIEVFKSKYPEAWIRIENRYMHQERKAKKGKIHPMPKPEKYLSNMYKVYKKKLKSE